MAGLATALARAGIAASDIDLHRIGEWQCVRTADKPHRRNGHVKVFQSNPIRLWFKNMATEVSGFFADEPSPYQQFRNFVRAAPVQDDRECYTSAAKIARHNWQLAERADPDHSYLKVKQIKPNGIRQLGQSLIIPMVDRNGTLWSTQTISVDGRKRYHKGGRKHGCYFPIGGKPENVLFLAEGFATAASVAECTGKPVAVCFDAGNLGPVAEDLRLKFPLAELIFCADNDAHTEGNPGMTKAVEAAKRVGGRVLKPTFPDDVNLSDWNDMRCHFGEEAVRNLFQEVI